MPFEVEDTHVKCRIPGCPGVIVKETDQKYIGDPRHMILGPGGESQLTTIVTLYCSRCGVQYFKMPE